jgi:serine/threonine-protein kinase HipA
MNNLLYLWWLGEPEAPRLVGSLKLLAEAGSRSNSVSLQYDASWLGNDVDKRKGFALSEDLPLSVGEMFASQRDCAVGAVDDARPDRWGERVIRFVLKPSRLSTLDCLYYAGDQRFGALGVSQSAEQYLPFDNRTLPLMIDIPEIFKLVQAIENGDAIAENLRRLISPGATMGGARPKALVAIDGAPWVVKFAEYGDAFDSAAVEHAAMTLAKKAGIESCETQVIQYANAGRLCKALLVKRFDRQGTRRIHALSAKVALSAEGSAFSYANLALLLRRRGDVTNIDKNAEQIFRRMIFNILIDNTDDHEKNHALLLNERGNYDLSPAFDVLPSGLGLGYQQLIVGKHGSESTLKNAMSDLPAFRITKTQALVIVEEVVAAINGWKHHFLDTGVAEKDIVALAPYIDGAALLSQRLGL